MPNQLFTFEDLGTGDLRDISAPNEPTARLWLGGIFTDVERTALIGSCPIGDLDRILAEAQAEERSAHKARVQANPMGKGPIATDEALQKFSDAEAAHAKAAARVRALLELRG